MGQFFANDYCLLKFYVHFSFPIQFRLLEALLRERTEGNPPRISDFTRSEEMEDIINGSTYVWVMEVSELGRLTSGTSVWISTDIYYVTVIESLKGQKEAGYEARTIFFADTVFLGEQHIVALDPPREGGSNYSFSSRNSLFSMDDLDQILETD